MAAKKLLDQVRDILRIKQYSYKTEKAYIHWIRCLGSAKSGLLGVKNKVVNLR